MKLSNKTHLQNKLTFIPLIGFAIGLAITFLCTSWLIRLYLDNYLLSQVTVYTQQISKDIISLIERDQETITAFSLSDTLMDMNNPSRMAITIERLLSRNKNFLEGFVVNLDGQTQVAVSRLQVFSKNLPNFQEQPIFQTAKEGKISVSGWENFTEKYRPYWYLAVPIEKNSSEIGGVLIVTIDLRRIEDLILTSQGAKYGDPILIDHKANVLVHLDRSKLGTNWGNLEVAQRILGGEIGTARYRDEKGQLVLAAFQPLNPYGWGIIVQVPPGQTIYFIRNNVIILLGLMTLAMFFITGLLTYFTAGKIVTPINELIQATQQFAVGKKTNYTPISGTDEVALLSSSFHAMANTLSEFEKQRAQYISMIAHDLRNPFSSIREIFRVIQEGKLTEIERSKSLTTIKLKLEQLSRMIEDLLEFSRLDLNQVNFRPETISIKYLCQDVISGYQGQSHRFMCQSFDDTLCAWADPIRLQQIFQNIFDNCLKHTPTETIIKIDCKEISDQLQIIITDNGPGIPPEILSNLFVPFHLGNQKRDSYGLGMAITKKLALAMKGDIFVKSTLGQGSKFIITLPRSI